MEKLLSASASSHPTNQETQQPITNLGPEELDKEGRSSSNSSFPFIVAYHAVILLKGVTSYTVIEIHDENPASSSEGSDRESSDDVVDWPTSPAEFRDIDEDIAVGTYIDSTHWLDDTFQEVFAPSQGLGARAVTTGFVEPESSASESRGWYQHPAWQFGTPQLAAPPPTPQDVVTRPPEALPWEFVEAPMVDQPAPPQTRGPSDWMIIGASASNHRQSQQAMNARGRGELQIIPVDPQQPPSQSRPQRRRPYEDRERQEDAGKTRGLKACVRCRMQKIKVRGRFW